MFSSRARTGPIRSYVEGVWSEFHRMSSKTSHWEGRYLRQAPQDRHSPQHPNRICDTVILETSSKPSTLVAGYAFPIHRNSPYLRARAPKIVSGHRTVSQKVILNMFEVNHTPHELCLQGSFERRNATKSWTTGEQSGSEISGMVHPKIISLKP